MEAEESRRGGRRRTAERCDGSEEGAVWSDDAWIVDAPA